MYERREWSANRRVNNRFHFPSHIFLKTSDDKEWKRNGTKPRSSLHDRPRCHFGLNEPIEAEMCDDWRHSSTLLISFRSTDFLRSDSFCQDDEDDDRDSELAGIEAPQLEFDEMGLELEANEGTGEVTQLPNWMRAAILLLL